jgi:hypothetical protein
MYSGYLLILNSYRVLLYLYGHAGKVSYNISLAQYF